MDRIRTTDTHPPLFQIIEWLWIHAECGVWSDAGDALARIPAVVAGVVSVWLTFLAARRLFGRNAAFAAGFLMAVSCFGIFYSQNARMQTLVTALFLAQTNLLLRILESRGNAGWGLWPHTESSGWPAFTPMRSACLRSARWRWLPVVWRTVP